MLRLLNLHILIISWADPEWEGTEEGVDRGGGGTGIEGAESEVEGAESGVEGAGSGSRGGGKRGNCGRGSGKIGGRNCFFFTRKFIKKK